MGELGEPASVRPGTGVAECIRCSLIRGLQAKHGGCGELPRCPGSGRISGRHIALASWHDVAERSWPHGWRSDCSSYGSVPCIWIQPVSWELALQVMQEN